MDSGYTFFNDYCADSLEYSGAFSAVQATQMHLYPTIKPGETLEVEAVAYRNFISEDGVRTREPFTDFYVEWSFYRDYRV